MERVARHLDDPGTTATVVVGIVFVALFVIVVLQLESWFDRVEDQEFQTKVMAQPFLERAQVRTEQLEALSGYRWVDRTAGTVAIPIERAMALVAQDLSEGGTE